VVMARRMVASFCGSGLVANWICSEKEAREEDAEV